LHVHPEVVFKRCARGCSESFVLQTVHKFIARTL
jgi:hypothetical protein